MSDVDPCLPSGRQGQWSMVDGFLGFVNQKLDHTGASVRYNKPCVERDAPELPFHKGDPCGSGEYKRRRHPELDSGSGVAAQTLTPHILAFVT